MPVPVEHVSMNQAIAEPANTDTETVQSGELAQKLGLV